MVKRRSYFPNHQRQPSVVVVAVVAAASRTSDSRNSLLVNMDSWAAPQGSRSLVNIFIYHVAPKFVSNQKLEPKWLRKNPPHGLLVWSREDLTVFQIHCNNRSHVIACRILPMRRAAPHGLCYPMAPRTDAFVHLVVAPYSTIA